MFKICLTKNQIKFGLYRLNYKGRKRNTFRLQCLYFLFILDLVNESKEDPKNKQTKKQRIQKNKSTLAEVEKLTSEVAEAVKLPQIDTKKGRGRKPKSAKTTAAAQDTNNVTIEEFVPALVSILSYNFR